MSRHFQESWLPQAQEAEGFQPDLERDCPVAEPRVPKLQLPPPQRR